MSEATWYHAKDGEALGPFTFAQLRERVVAGAIGTADLLCQVGKTDWVTALSVPGLIPPPPPPPGTKRRLVPCAKCMETVSDEAETCPHCGEHQPKWEQKEYGWPGDSCDKCGVFKAWKSHLYRSVNFLRVASRFASNLSINPGRPVSVLLESE